MVKSLCTSYKQFILTKNHTRVMLIVKGGDGAENKFISKLNIQKPDGNDYVSQVAHIQLALTSKAVSPYKKIIKRTQD